MHKRFTKEIHDEYITKMGPSLGPICIYLCEEQIMLYKKWNEFKKLFLKSKERVDLLNKTAPSFFSLIQHVLWEDIILHLARITDPPESAGKENLTFLRIPSLIENAELLKQINSMIEEVKKTTRFARDWRNKHIGHIDFKCAINVLETPLEEVKYTQIDDSLKLLSDILNQVQYFYFETSMLHNVLCELDDADTLIDNLNCAVYYKNKRKERFLNGNPYPEDYEKPANV